MARDVCKICNIIEQIQFGRTVMFCSKREYNSYIKITRRINCVVKYIEENDLNQYKKKVVSLLLFQMFLLLDILLARKNLHSLLFYNR